MCCVLPRRALSAAALCRFLTALSTWAAASCLSTRISSATGFGTPPDPDSLTLPDHCSRSHMLPQHSRVPEEEIPYEQASDESSENTPRFPAGPDVLRARFFVPRQPEPRTEHRSTPRKKKKVHKQALLTSTENRKRCAPTLRYPRFPDNLPIRSHHQ